MKKAYALTGGLSVAAIAAVLLSSTSLYKQVVPIPESQPQTVTTPVTPAIDTSTATKEILVPQKADEPVVEAQAPKPEQQIAIATPAEKKPVPATQEEAINKVVADKKGKEKQEPGMRANIGAGKNEDGLKDAERGEVDSNVLIAAPATTASSINGAEKSMALGRASGSLDSRSRLAQAPMAEGMMYPATPPMDVTSSYYHDQGRDKFETIKETPNKIVKEEPVSTFSVDVDTASYSFVRGELNRGEMPQKDAVRVEEMINYFDYSYALPASKEEPFQPNIAVYPTPWNTDTKIVQIGVKGYDIVAKEKPRANLTFLLDVSGSMNEPNKLPLLKQSLRMLVNELKADDSVAIVVYAGNAGTVLEPTKVKDKQKIIDALDKLEAGGSTAGGEGINLAYKLAEQNFDKEGVNRVILATDGDFNVGITDPEELKSFIVRKRETGITLSVLGFGEGNYNDELMQKLAQNGNGNASYIDTVNEARKVLVNEAGSTLFTIAKDVKIQVEFNPAEVSEYRLIGYTTRILNREDFNNDKVDAGDIGAGHKVTALYEITPKGAKGSVDPLRYGAREEVEKKEVAENLSNGEYAFLKIRYKLPDASTSKLMTHPITHADDVKDAASVKSNLGFAAAVAAFGQKLAGDSHLGEFSYDDILNLAKATRGEDEFGYRTEFMQLVRTAKSLSGEKGGMDKPIE